VRNRPRRRDASVLVDRFDDLVAVVGEANAWPYDCGERYRDELVHWVAERVATGERFAALAAPTGALSPSTPFHTELSEAQLRGGGSRDELVTGFAGFVRDSDICCAWGCYAFELMRGAGGALPGELLDLRAHVKGTSRQRVGSLEDYTAALAVGSQRDGGRAIRRLGLLVAAIRHLRAAALA
jgi:hypothetical protein